MNLSENPSLPETAKGSKPSAGISKKSTINAIDQAEIEFLECWKVVSTLTSGTITEEFTSGLVDFQLRLFDALVNLEDYYRRIKQEEKRLVKRKYALKAEWFVIRMRRLSSYSAAIREALTIGRCIGDAFAWFFYQFDRELISEHLACQRQILMPTGVGRLGERLTLKNMLSFNGQMLLSHGITTFLRLGDCSLVDLKALRVRSIVELKSHRVDPETVSVLVTFVAGESGNLPEIKFSSEPQSRRTPEPAMRSAAMKDRARRQVQTYQKAIKKSNIEVDEKLDVGVVDFYYDALRDVVRRSHSSGFEFIHAGDGMLIGAVRPSNSRSLGRTLISNNADVSNLMNGVSKWVEKIALKGQAENSLILNSVGAGHHRILTRSANIPFAMWPVPPDVLKDVIFDRVVVIAMFNPLHFVNALRERGFLVTTNERGEPVHAERAEGDKRLELQHMEHWSSLIQNDLMSEKAVLKMIDESISLISLKASGRQTRVKINPRMLRHVPPTAKRK